MAGHLDGPSAARLRCCRTAGAALSHHGFAVPAPAFPGDLDERTLACRLRWRLCARYSRSRMRLQAKALSARCTAHRASPADGFRWPANPRFADGAREGPMVWGQAHAWAVSAGGPVKGGEGRWKYSLSGGRALAPALFRCPSRRQQRRACGRTNKAASRDRARLHHHRLPPMVPPLPGGEGEGVLRRWRTRRAFRSRSAFLPHHRRPPMVLPSPGGRGARVAPP